MDFKVGDTVWLKSGGLAMTVETVHTGSREVRCVWSASVGGVPRLLKDIFHFESLTKTEPAAQPSHVEPVPDADRVYEEGDD